MEPAGRNQERSMTMKPKSQIYAEAIKKWGSVSQMLMAVEKMSKLQKAILKYLRCLNFGQGDLESCVNALIEETADVEITLEQLKMIFSCSTRVEEAKAQKLSRLEMRLGE